MDFPVDLFKCAWRLRDQYREEFDSVWCVVDVDNFDVAEARAVAEKVGVDLVVSDPCFEVWLLLHFADHQAHIADYRAARDLLTRHVPGYDKKLEYTIFDGTVEVALDR